MEQMSEGTGCKELRLRWAGSDQIWEKELGFTLLHQEVSEEL